MDQFRNLADARLLHGCTYCGSNSEDTRDHVPSKILLDPPYPSNLPVVPACKTCNNGFSRDEEYLACLIECTIVGSTDPTHVQRSGIAKILSRSPALRARIEAAKQVTSRGVAFTAEDDRVRNVILKLARGHAAFELSSPVSEQPTSVLWWPLALMSEEEIDAWDAAHVTDLIGEIGSRGTQRLLATQLTLASVTGKLSALNVIINDWIDVQEGRYRYLAIDFDDGVVIKIVLSEFLACEVFWESGRIG